MTIDQARMKARYLFGGGLIFFIAGIVTDHPAIIGFAVLLLVGALIYHSKSSKSTKSSENN